MKYQKHRQLTDEDLPKVITLLGTHSVIEVAESFKTRRNAVQRFLKARGLSPTKVKAEQRVKLYELYHFKGYSHDRIAKMLRVHPTSLYKILTTVRQKKAVTYSIPDEDLPLVSELVCTMPLKEVADKWDVATSTLRAYFYRHGTSTNKLRLAYRIPIVKAELEKGKSLTEIADLLDLVDYRSVQHIIDKM